MTFSHTRIAGSSLSLLVTAVLGAAGCEGPKGNLGEFSDSNMPDTDDGTSTTEGTSEGTSTTDGATTTVGTSTTVGTATTVGTSTTDGTSDGTTAEPVGETDGPDCVDPEPGLEASFKLTFEPPLLMEQNVKYASNCTVTSLSAGDTSATVALDCEDRTATLELSVSLGFSPLFGEGDLLALKYHSSMPFWINEWFTLRFATEGLPLLVGGVNADSLLPLDDDDSTLFEPVLVNAQHDVCALPASCDDPMERLAVGFKYDQDVLELVSGTSGLIGELTSFRAILPRARQYHDMDCGIEDIPPTWFKALLILIPEG